MEELRKLWGQNINRGRHALTPEGRLRLNGDDPMPQSRLAELLNVTQQTVSDWERGAMAPRDDMKVRIAEVLHQDVRQLFPLIRTVGAR